ncbi:MAG: DoxX family membrane protein [Vicinamibacterales bacterium]
MASTPAARGLTALRIVLGVFFLFEGLGKVGWFADAGPLTARLTGYLQNANAWNRPYLEAVCLPGVTLFARLVPLGELATGVSFLLGAYARWAAIAAFLMVANIHFASGVLFQYSFLTNGYALPVLGGLLALAIGGGSLPFSLKRT